MKSFATIVMLLISGSLYGQTPHVTQPFSYLWDYANANLQAVAGFTQVAHWEFQLDTTVPTTIPLPIPFTASATAGFSTFKLLANPALPVGSHTFNIIACPTLVVSTVAASGCVAAPSPFAFVLDPPALPPLPSAQRLGVGV